WTYLDDHLHGGPPRPASPDQNSPRPGPLDQAPWLHAMLSGQHHTDSPPPSSGDSPSQGTNTLAPEDQPPPKRPRRQSHT
ncbi:MAG TPA: hypothetical protein VFP72_05405, partial [Kineosporiaceae bacterium]|nr:hypothetical protein [Kineosporiaceae bacterium]